MLCLDCAVALVSLLLLLLDLPLMLFLLHVCGLLLLVLLLLLPVTASWSVLLVHSSTILYKMGHVFQAFLFLDFRSEYQACVKEALHH